jgi:hypothetical protein
MTEPILIEARFNGPASSAQGGYVAGRLAAWIDGAAEVTLRLPPPLDVAMEVEPASEAVLLRLGAEVVAEARPAHLELQVPEPPGFDEAAATEADFAGWQADIVPTCFGCGTGRPAGDGLRLLSGPIAGRDMVAAPWLPDAGLAGADGLVRPEFLWTALDCPGGWAINEPGETVVLGRFVVEVHAPVRPGARLVVSGWPLGRDGRKLWAGSALHDAHGSLVAAARATWIALR